MERSHCGLCLLEFLAPFLLSALLRDTVNNDELLARPASMYGVPVTLSMLRCCPLLFLMQQNQSTMCLSMITSNELEKMEGKGTGARTLHVCSKVAP